MGARGVKSGRGGGRNSAPYQRRADRHHGGPPRHILEKQAAARARKLQREQAMMAVSAIATATPPTSVPSVRSAPPTSVPRVPLRLVSSTNQPRVAPIATDPTADKRAANASWQRHRFAAALLLIPMIGTIGLMALRSREPVTTVPPVIVATPVEPSIDRRIVAMLPPISLALAPPPIPAPPPGSIQFAALRFPSEAPAVVGIAPIQVVVPRLPSDLVPSLAEALLPPKPGSITLAALTLPERAPDVPAIIDTPPAAPLVIAPVAVAPAIAPALAPALATPADTAATLDTSHQCVAAQTVAQPTPQPSTPADYGVALAQAAKTQTAQFVVYDARYTRIAYPGGDVDPLYGVCTDVVIRAYRALGVDLQVLVQQARVGRGDTSIDHRRTETLRKFFALHGQSIPVTDFAEDYQPGDIVTYYRPQNKSSTAHIAVISDVIAPSGRPMIIHNRGLGVQLEDALFVDRITGHYRYRAPIAEPVTVAIASASKASPVKTAPLKTSVVLKPVATRLAFRATQPLSGRVPQTAIPQVR